MFWIKVLVSGLLVAGSSAIARRYPGPAGIVVALPITTFLAMALMYWDGARAAEFAPFLLSVGWITVAGLGLFFVTPWLLRMGWGLGPALAVGLGAFALGTALVATVTQSKG